MKPKIIITGYARHGKDTVCDTLKKLYGYSFESSSQILAEEVVFPALKDKYGYETIEQCYEDRVNHRQEWFTLLADYNKHDLTKLGTKIFESYDIYCGLRNIHEYHAMRLKGMFDLLIWVDAFDRVKTTESSESMTLDSSFSDIIIRNNGTLKELDKNVESLACLLASRSHIENIILTGKRVIIGD